MVLIGQISPSIKSVAWPYFVFFSGGTRRSPAPEMNASELERYSRVLGSLFRRDLTPADLEELRGVFRDYTTRTGRYNSPEEMRLFTAGMRVAGEYQYELARSMLLSWDQQSYFTSPKFDELAKQMKGQRKAELLALDLDWIRAASTHQTSISYEGGARQSFDREVIVSHVREAEVYLRNAQALASVIKEFVR